MPPAKPPLVLRRSPTRSLSTAPAQASLSDHWWSYFAQPAWAPSQNPPNCAQAGRAIGAAFTAKSAASTGPNAASATNAVVARKSLFISNPLSRSSTQFTELLFSCVPHSKSKPVRWRSVNAPAPDSDSTGGLREKLYPDGNSSRNCNGSLKGLRFETPLRHRSAQQEGPRHCCRGPE